jgi:hypothetical protein
MQTLCHLRPVLDIGNPGGGSYCRGDVVTRLQADLDYWLARWWSARDRPSASEGYPAVSAYLKNYRTSRQHDDTNGALDQDIDAMVIAQVDHDISAMEADSRLAISYEACRLSLGVAVFMLQRLPADRAELAALVLMARNNLTMRLLASGVLSR